MELHYDHIKNLVEENAALKKRLKDVSQLNKKLDKQIQKKNKQIKFLNMMPFLEKNEKYNDINSTINNPNLFASNQAKQSKMNAIKEQMHKSEFDPCSFTPKINKASSEMVEKSNYVPIQKRPLPKPLMRSTNNPNNHSADEDNELKESKVLDPDFYQNQLNWKNQIQKNYEEERKFRDDKELKDAGFMPMNTQQIAQQYKDVQHKKMQASDMSTGINTVRTKYKMTSQDKKINKVKKSSVDKNGTGDFVNFTDKDISRKEDLQNYQDAQLISQEEELPRQSIASSLNNLEENKIEDR